MANTTVRDPKTDHLLTHENAALILIDFQPGLVDGTNSIDRSVLVNNVVALAKAGKMFNLPIILTTIGEDAKRIERDRRVARNRIVQEEELSDDSPGSASRTSAVAPFDPSGVTDLRDAISQVRTHYDRGRYQEALPFGCALPRHPDRRPIEGTALSGVGSPGCAPLPYPYLDPIGCV